MEIQNRTDKILSDDVEDILQKMADEHNIKLSNSVVVEDVNNQGLLEVTVGYNGTIDLSETLDNPVGNPELYSAMIGDVSLLQFSDEELNLQVYSRA